VELEFGFISATEEAPVRPDVFSFGVNVSCITFDALKSARLPKKRVHGRLLPFLRLELTRGSVTLDVDIQFDRGSLKDAEALVYFLTGDMQGEEEVCIS
jgi:hypothetical protein